MGLTRKQIIMLAVLISGSFITILNQTLVTPALPTIMEETGVDASTVQWLTTGFTMVNAVMIPVTAFLTDRFPTRGLFITAMSVFCVGTLMCAWSPNFPVLLVGRLVQASGAGVLMPMVGNVLMLTFPVEKRGFAMGLFGVIIMFAPALGPTISGVIIDHASWHFVFFIVTVLTVVDILCGVFALEKTPHEVPDGLSLDRVSVAMSTIGFGGMLYGFSVIGSSGVSAVAVISVMVGLVVTVFFFRRQLKLAVPMLEVRVLKTRKFLVATILGMIVQAGIMANGVLMPIYVQTLCGYGATVSGLVLLPGAIIMGIMSPISGSIFDKRGPRVMSIFGTILLTLTTAVMCNLTTTTSMIFLGVMIALRNFSMSLVNMPINTWGMNALPNRYINHGNAVNNTLRQAAGSLGTALVVSAYSIATAFNMQTMDQAAASMAGFNFAFVVQTVIFACAAVIAIFAVKELPSDEDHKLDRIATRNISKGAKEGDKDDLAQSGESEAAPESEDEPEPEKETAAAPGESEPESSVGNGPEAEPAPEGDSAAAPGEPEQK